MSSEWIGKRFVARCLMHLPDQGERKPGEEFTFTAACAAIGLRPESWLKIGNAELAGKVTPGPGPSEKPPSEKPHEKLPEKPRVVDAKAAPPVAVPRKEVTDGDSRSQ